MLDVKRELSKFGEDIKRIDLRSKPESPCSLCDDRDIETFFMHIYANSDPGDRIELILDDKDVWDKMAVLGDDYGYIVLSKEALSEEEYKLVIEII
jgi:hypothetical protein